MKPAGGEWTVVSKARFTADPTPSDHVDAGPLDAEHGFFLKTGGETKMETSKLWSHMDSAKVPETVPNWVKTVPQ